MVGTGEGHRAPKLVEGTAAARNHNRYFSAGCRRGIALCRRAVVPDRESFQATEMSDRGFEVGLPHAMEHIVAFEQLQS